MTSELHPMATNRNHSSKGMRGNFWPIWCNIRTSQTLPSGPPFPLLPPSAYVPVVMGTRENGKGNNTGLKIYNGGCASAKVRSAGVSISYK